MLFSLSAKLSDVIAFDGPNTWNDNCRMVFASQRYREREFFGLGGRCHYAVESTKTAIKRRFIGVMVRYLASVRIRASEPCKRSPDARSRLGTFRRRRDFKSDETRPASPREKISILNRIVSCIAIPVDRLDVPRYPGSELKIFSGLSNHLH